MTEIRSAAEIRTFAAAVLEPAGMPLADAEVALAWADLRDIPAQGPGEAAPPRRAAARWRDRARPTVRTVRRTAATTAFDVDDE